MRKILSALMMLMTMLISIFVANVSFAVSNLPENCPSADNIKSVGLNYFFYSPNRAWAASYLKHQYETNDDWTFLMSGEGEEANSEEEAKQKAYDELESLVFSSGPFYRVNGDTVCLYETNKLKKVLTISPPINVNLFSLLH